MTIADTWQFFAGAYLWTWVFWISAGLGERGLLALPVPAIVLMILGGLGPMAAALAVAARREGRAGVAGLFGQLRLRGLRRRWLLIAFAIGLLDLVPALMYLLDGGFLPAGIGGQVLAMPVHFLFIAAIGGGLDEEMGWRAFAQPRMQRLTHPFLANLLVGVAWASWHLPMWLDPDGSHAATPFVVFLVTVVAQSLVISWLYNASGGSLLVAIVAHSAADMFDGLRFAIVDDPTWATRSELLQMVVMLGAALVVTFATRGMLGRGRDTDDAVSEVAANAADASVAQSRGLELRVTPHIRR